MSKISYYLIDSSILPEVYSKVIKAKNLISSGEAKSTSEAVKMAGISRSAYYKYKDKIFEYNEQGDDTATLNAKLYDNAGVLSSVMNEIFLAGANVLSINQSVPVNQIADVSITIRTSQAKLSGEELIEKIQSIKGVSSIDYKGGK